MTVHYLSNLVNFQSLNDMLERTSLYLTKKNVQEEEEEKASLLALNQLEGFCSYFDEIQGSCDPFNFRVTYPGNKFFVPLGLGLEVLGQTVYTLSVMQKSLRLSDNLDGQEFSYFDFEL